MIWLPATLFAGLCQAWRTAVQQRVRAHLSVNAAGLVRYLYGFPVGCLLLWLYLGAGGHVLPARGDGFLFAFTSVFVKHATFTVATEDKVLAALTVLVAVLFLQMLMQGAYVAARERAEVPKIFRSWCVSGQVGLLAALGSACWFTGFATAPVALVRAVGQVEVIFTLGFGHFYLKEPMARHEAGGILIVALGVVLALVGAL